MKTAFFSSKKLPLTVSYITLSAACFLPLNPLHAAAHNEEEAPACAYLGRGKIPLKEIERREEKSLGLSSFRIFICNGSYTKFQK